MNKNISARRKTEWNLMFISTGEETLEQKMQSIGQRTRGGQQARFVNIEADADRGRGIFEELHDFDSPNLLARHLSTASRKFYGTPIRAFLRAVCANRRVVDQRLEECRQMLQARVKVHDDASGEVYSVASRFALVAAGGILVSEFGVAAWSKSEVTAAVERIFAEWIKHRGGHGSYDTERGVRQVLAFIAEHGSSRFQNVDLSERVVNRAGFKRGHKDGGTEYLIFREVFEHEICRGYSHTAVAKELKKRKLLQGGEKNSLQKKVTLPECRRQQRVYAVVNDGDGVDDE